MRFLDWKDFYFSPNGRVSNNEFIVFFILPYVLLLSSLNSLPSFVESIVKISLLIGVWPFLMLLIKRFHDFGMPGVVAIIVYPVISLLLVISIVYLSHLIYEPVLEKQAGLDSNNHEAKMAVGQLLEYSIKNIAMSVSCVICLAVPFLIPGDKERNYYGEPS